MTQTTTATMLAAVYNGDGHMLVESISVPEPRAGEVLIAVSHCGICGTDLHLVLEKYARPGAVLGHEWAGTIAALGEGVEGWRVGQRVVAGPTPGCGECRSCRRNRPSVCRRREEPDYLGFSGAYCEYKTVSAARLIELPESLSTRAAALTEPTAIAIHTVGLADIEPDDRVLVTGGGPVGLLTTAVLRQRGITDITVSEPSPVRRERALAVGARAVVKPEDLPRAPIGRAQPGTFDMAFECSGNAKAAESAIDQLNYAGTLVFVGTGHESPRVNHNRAIVLELTIIGAYNYDADGFGPAVALLASGDLPLDALIEDDDITLDALDGTLRRLAAGELPGKVMVRPEVRTVS
ncbi:MAG TPA: alcohol dehydrogenase catalytic domain-containing protein [Acidimicrobiia bacterium]|jgi:(R,R)-butanediol dehydrogenase/meso-butanediol dehydrogenase/diacetyl reductase